ncbi:hypothetical protein B0H13DRAFT_1615495, partial [Mycena leptocephala]
SSSLVCRNLSFNMNDESLHQAFSQFGQITDHIVMKDRETGRSRGFGFVTFSNESEAQNAINSMNEQECDGRRLRVNVANARGGSSGGGGGWSSLVSALIILIRPQLFQAVTVAVEAAVDMATPASSRCFRSPCY